jgi:hypothetical protein
LVDLVAVGGGDFVAVVVEGVLGLVAEAEGFGGVEAGVSGERQVGPVGFRFWCGLYKRYVSIKCIDFRAVP